MTSPAVRGEDPKTAPRIDSRPEPVSPAMPTISPGATSKETSRSVPSPRPRTSRTGSALASSPTGGGSSSRHPSSTSISTSRERSMSPTAEVPTILPSRSTVTRSAIRKTSSRWWVTNRMATPARAVARIISNSRSTSSAGRDAVGSSSTSTRAGCAGSGRIARATAAPVRSAAPRSRSSDRGSTELPTRASCSVASRTAARRRIVPSRVAYPAPRARLSSTDASPISPRSWCTKRQPARYERSPAPKSSGLPATRTSLPGLGSW